MSTTPRRTALRLATSSAIAVSTALATAAVMLPAPAFGQALPSIGATGSDGGATITSPGNDLHVNLNDANRVISWETFDVNSNRNVDFITANTTTPFSVLNRVITNAQSDINGAITSQSNISVWLVNQTGIFFGPNGSFSGGRLVLSTLDLDASFTDANFLAGTGTARLSGASGNAITLQSGGTGTIDGSFIAIGQDITVAKTVNASGSEVAFIAARDVSFPMSIGSPLAITINQGTTLATAKIDTSSAITGANVRLVGASNGGAIASLLNVSGGSLTATATDGAVVLATGTVAAKNVTVSSPAGTDGITTAGAINAGAGKDLIINATGAFSAGGGLTARDVSITAASGVPVTGITATRDLSLSQTGGGLTFDPNALGAATWGRDISLTARDTVDVSSLLQFNSAGAINITSTTGNIESTGAAVARLSAGTDINLNAAAGNVNFASLVTGAAAQNISITAQSITLPGINASLDLSLTDTLGDLTFVPASVAWGRDINLTSSAGAVLVTGNLTSPGAARITAATNIQADSIATTNGAIVLTATGNVLGNPGTMALNAGGANGDIAVIANQADFTTVTAANSIAIRAGGNLTGTTFDAGEDIAIDGGGAVNVTTLTADDDINVQAAGLITLGTVSTDGSGPDTRTVGVTGTPITFTPSAANNANINIRSTGDGLSLTTSATTAGAAGGGITLGAATSIDARTLTSAQDITLSAPVSTTGAIAYTAGGNISGDSISNTVAGGIALRAGGNVGGNPGNMTLSSSGAGDVTVIAGGTASFANITSGDSIAIRSVGNVTGTTFDAGEDVAIGVTGVGNTVNVTTINADDDIDVTSVGAITVGTALSRGTGPDTRRVNLSTTPISFDAPEPADHLNASIRLTSSNGAVNLTTSATTQGAAGQDILLSGTTVNATSLTAVRNIAITGPVSTTAPITYTATNGSIKVDSITATNGSISLTAATDVTGNTIARMGIAANGAASNLSVRATAGQAQLGTVSAGNDIGIVSGTATDITSGTATAGDLTITAGATAGLGNLTAGKSIGVKAVGATTGGTLDASEDIAIGVSGAGSTVNITNLRASDDIDLNAAGNITVTTLLARGTGNDTRRVDLTTATPTFGAETADHLGSNIRVKATGVGNGITLNTSATAQGANGADLILDSATGVAASGATLNAVRSAVVFGRAGLADVGTAIAGEDAVVIGTSASLGTGTAGDDLAVIGSTGTARLGTGNTTSTGTRVDLRAPNVGGADIAFSIGDSGVLVGSSIAVQAAGAVTVGSATSAIGNVFVQSVGGDLSGLVGDPSTGGPLAGFGRANLTASALDRTVTVLAAGTAQLGTVTAGGGTGTITADQLTVNAGTIDMTTGVVRDGRAVLTSTVGDVAIAGSLTARGNATLNSAANVRIADYVSATPGPESGFVRSTAGNVSVTAARSVIGYAGSNTMTSATGIDSLAADGTITITGSDVRVDSITAAGDIGINITGSLTGTAPAVGERGTGLTGGAIFASGTAGVDAGNTAPDLVRLNRIEAGGNITVDATNIAIGSLRTPGAFALTGGNFYIGEVSTPGNLTIAYGAGLANVNPASITTTDVIETGFGKTAIASTGGAVTATIGDNAQLGTVNAANAVSISADGLTANGLVRSVGGSVDLTATEGTLQTAAVTANTTATIRKQGVATLTPGDELRALSTVASGGDLTVSSTTNVRASDLTATDGFVSATASSGDLTGLELVTAATDGRMLSGFGRANLTASGTNRTATASASGIAQLGAVTAGNGLGTIATAQAGIFASAIDANSITAVNGRLDTNSFTGETRIATVSAGTNANVTAATNARLGSVTSRAGDIDVRATAGDISGLAGASAAGDPLAGFGRTNLTASAQDRTIAVTATGASSGTVQLGTLTAGVLPTVSAPAQITINARAVNLTTALANNGQLAITATAGDAVVGTGTAGSTAAVTASGNVRVGTLTSRTFDARATATNGDVTGLAVIPGAPVGASSLTATQTVPFNAGFNAANIVGNGAGGAFVTANNGAAQLGTVTGAMSITVNARALSVNAATSIASGNVTLNATAGSLVLGTGTIGGNATLTKTGATGEVDVINLSTGNFNGFTGAATVTSSTNIRADSVTARGANIALTAADGEVTGRGAGGRAVLTAALGKNGAGVDIPASDRSVFVTSGTLSHLGAVQAGDAITVQTGDSLVAARDGAIDGTTFTAARGDVTLSVFNDAGAPSGVTATSINAGGSALLRTTGSNGGSITLNSVTAASNVLLDTSGSATNNVLVDTVTSTGASIGVRSTGLVTGTIYSANADIAVLSTGALSLGTANAGDDIGLTAASVGLGTATARGDGPDNTSVNLGLLPASPFVAGGADNGNLTIASTAGAVDVTGDLTAQRNVSITSVGGATTLAGNVTAGAAPITGNLTVNSGGALTLGNAAARTVKATGAVSLTAAGNITQGAGALTIQSNSDQVGTEALNIVATTPANITLGGVALIGGSVAGRESVVDLRATGGTVSFGKVDANGLTVRAGGQVTNVGGITTGNAARPADPVGGFNTVDISTTAGGIQLDTATAIGAGHDIALTAPGLIGVPSVTAARNITATGGSIDISTATATTGALSLTANFGALRLGTGNAGTDAALTKTGATGEIDVILLTSGALNGSSGSTAITSSTSIRAGAISARGGTMSLSAVDGEVTGRGAGARTNLLAVQARDGSGADIAGTDRALTVVSGGLTRIDTATGESITITAGDSGVASRDGGIDALTLVATRGNALLRTFNDDAASTSNNLRADTVVAGGAALMEAAGSNGGAITSNSITATGAVLLNTGSTTNGAISATTVIAGNSIAVRSSNSLTGTTFTAGVDIAASVTQGITLGSATAGDDISLTGASVSLGSATARGNGIDTSSLNLALLPGSPFVSPTAADNANITIASTAGAVSVSGDLSAQRNVSVTSVGGATTLAGNITAGAPVVPAGPVIAGDLSVNSGGALTLGNAAARTLKATGALSLTAAGNITQGAGALTVQSNSDQAGTEALTVTATTPASIELGNTAFVGGSVAGRESVATITASGGTVTLGTVDANGLTVRAGGQVTSGTINAGNGARPADPVATFNTIDIVTTAGGIGLTTATAFGAGHDIRLQAPGAVQATTLTAARNLSATGGSVTIGTATSSAGNLLLDATAGDATLGTGTAGGTSTVQATGAAGVTSLTAGGTATLTAGTAATAGTITSTGADVAINGANVTVGTADAKTALSVTASNGNLTIDKGIAGTTGLLRTTGGNGDVTVTTSLATGTGATVSTVRHARLTSVTATTGNIDVTATSGEVTGIDTATATDLVATAGAVNVINGLLSRLGTVSGNGVTVASGTIVASDINAGTGALSLTANNGPASLTTGNAGTTALVQSSAAATVDSLTAGTDATIRGTSVDATTVTATGGALLVDATAGNATLGTGIAGGAGTVRASGAAGLTSLTAGGTATLTAGTAATAGTVGSTGADVAINGATATVGTADAKTALSVTASNGDLTIDKGIAGTTGLLRTTGGNGDVIITTSLETGGAATVETVRHARLALVRAATGNVTVTAPNGEVTGIGTAGANLTATAGAVNVTNGALANLGTVSGNGVTVASGTIVANDINAGIGALSLVAGNGPATLTTGHAGTTALVQSSAATTVGTLTAGTDATIRGTSVSATTATATGGALLVNATAGNATLGTGTAGGTGTVLASGNADITSLTAAGTVTLTAGSAINAGTIRSTGADIAITGASVVIGTADARTALTATATNGALTLGTGTAGTTGALRTTGGGANGDITVSTSLTTGGAATITSVSDVRLASVTAGTGALTVTAANGEVTGVGAGNANLVASAGSVSVEGGTLARLGTVGAAGATGVTVTADTIAATNVNAGTGALSLVADTGGVTLGTGRSGATALIDAKQTATISTSLTAGTSARINAADADIGGPVTATTRIDVVNTGTGTLVLGDATGTGFQLSETEVNRLNAPEVALDAKSTNIAIGKLAFDGDTGGNRVDVLGLDRIDVTGTVSAPGGSASRAIRFGGSATASDKASIIRVAATATGAGGRLLMPNAQLELRGVKIGVGQDNRFLDSLGLTPGGTPITVAKVGTDFISNPQSTLFYAGNFGGAPYNPIGQTLVEASALTVRTTDYALFQNTGTVGQSLGVVLDARTTNPRVPALTVAGPNPPDVGGFAIFGNINGFEASAAALLGATDISIIAVDGRNARINGCIIGSGGGGCLSNSIVQPVVNVFDSSRSDVLKTSSDFEAPFDPVVGTNNESLFGDVGTFGLEDIPLTPDPDPSECGGADQAPCATSEGEKK